MADVQMVCHRMESLSECSCIRKLVIALISHLGREGGLIYLLWQSSLPMQPT